MVKPSSGSRPAALTQEQVDDLARGNHHEVARILRSTRPEPAPDEHGPTEAGARPVDLAAKDIEAIRRSGLASSGLARKISEAARPEASAQRKGKAGLGTKKTTSSPTVKPGDSEGSGRRRRS